MGVLFARQRMENQAFQADLTPDESRSWVLEKGAPADDDHPARRLHPSPVLWSATAEEALKFEMAV